MRDRRRWLTALLALALPILVAGTALGYAGEVAASVTVARQGGTVKCAENITLTATVRDAQNKVISGQPVTWSWVSRVSGKDVINRVQATTNGNGVASTTIKLDCVPGSRVVRAAADDVQGQVTINLTAAGLPRTSTLVAGPATPSDPVLGIVLAILALAAGGGLAVRGVLARR